MMLLFNVKLLTLDGCRSLKAAKPHALMPIYRTVERLDFASKEPDFLIIC